MKTAAKMLLGFVPGLSLSGGGAPKAFLSFDGTNDNLVVTQAASINNLGSGDFTVDFVAWWDASENGAVLDKDGTSVGWLATLTGGDLYFYVNCASDLLYRAATVVDDTTFRHYELVWDASEHLLHIFINGVEQTYTDELVYDAGAYGEEGAVDLNIFSEGSTFTAGALRWFRVSNTARHTSNFTPPSLSVAPDTDANTVLLLALDEGTGTPVDTSGNTHTITLNGATWG